MLQVGVVEAADGTLKIYGDAVGERGGQPQDAVLTAAAGQLAAVERGDGFGPADGGHQGAVGEAGEGGQEVGSGQPVLVVDHQRDGGFAGVDAAGVGVQRGGDSGGVQGGLLA